MKNILLLVPGGSIILGIFSFATSTVGMILIAATLSYGTGWHMRAERCEAADLRARLEAVQADLSAASDSAAFDRSKSADLEVSDRANREKINALTRDLKSRPGRDCGLSDGDARRLRDIR